MESGLFWFCLLVTALAMLGIALWLIGVMTNPPSRKESQRSEPEPSSLYQERLEEQRKRRARDEAIAWVAPEVQSPVGVEIKLERLMVRRRANERERERVRRAFREGNRKAKERLAELKRKMRPAPLGRSVKADQLEKVGALMDYYQVERTEMPERVEKAEVPEETGYLDMGEPAQVERRVENEYESRFSSLDMD